MNIESRLTREQINALPFVELRDIKDRVDDICQAIKSQLDAAKARYHATGEPANPKWFVAASTKLRYMNKNRIMLQEAMGQKRREENIRRSQSERIFYEVHFIQVAKEVLSDEMYNNICQEASFRTRGK